MRSTFVYSDEMAWFDFGPEHPFKPERAAKTYELCGRYGVMDHPWMDILDPDPLDIRIAERFHDAGYLHILREADRGKVDIKTLEHGLGTDDNPILPGIFEWSLRAAGGTHAAMERILHETAGVAFNPLGGFHHAMADHAEGFCYINDIAIAIRSALEESPHLKVCYLDLDAHHGNGVQAAFYDDPRVLVTSLHETGKSLYPWSGFETETGEGAGRGFTLNFPLTSQSDDEVYRFALDTAVLPVVRAFSPDMVVLLVGADALVSDPLTHLKLTNNSYRRAVADVMTVCGKILALGGGGYDLYRTARCWTLAWAALNGLEPVDEFAGLVGGMMFGPENEVGSLYDHPYITRGPDKETAFEAARQVADFIRETVFPVHGLPPEPDAG